MGHEDQGCVADLSNRREVLQGVEGQLREHAGIDHHRAVEAQHQGVAVGWRALHGRRSDVAGSAGPVVDNHLLPEALAQVLGDQAAAGIGHAAGRERDHQANRLGWPRILRQDGPGRQAGAQRDCTGRRGEPASAAGEQGRSGVRQGHGCLRWLWIGHAAGHLPAAYSSSA